MRVTTVGIGLPVSVRATRVTIQFALSVAVVLPRAITIHCNASASPGLVPITSLITVQSNALSSARPHCTPHRMLGWSLPTDINIWIDTAVVARRANEGGPGGETNHLRRDSQTFFFNL